MTVSQLAWCKDVTTSIELLKEKPNVLQLLQNQCIDDVEKLADLVKDELSSVQRAVITALITVQMHARDVVIDLIKKQVIIYYNMKH